MFRSTVVTGCCLTLILLFGCSSQAAQEEGSASSEKRALAAPSSLEEKVAYSIGANLGGGLKQQQVDLDIDYIIKGFEDAMAGEELLLTPEEMQEAVGMYQQQLAQEAGQRNRDAGEEFLAANQVREEVVTLPSGLQYEVVEAGDGPKPGPTDRVTVHYRGTLVDGTQFDSSYDRGQPATFRLDQVIPGWSEGLQLMSEGATYKLFIPGDLAYGPNPPPGPIGPDATLIFTVELLDIEE